ncbi:MAG: ABC transporter substrate-binding protein [Thermoanaerobaculia bacterium]|nr:ABC transporter substrate-binding protein [Thermoanaerobaculia bacterium]
MTEPIGPPRSDVRLAGHRRCPLLVLALVVCLFGCERQIGTPLDELPAVGGIPTRNLESAAVADFDPSVDYFPDKINIRHASQIEVEYHRHYKVARIETRGMGEEFEFVLVQRGTAIPETRRDALVIQVPVTRFSLGTFRYGRAAELLGVVDHLVGFGNHAHATVPAILKLFETGKLKKNFNLEAIAERGTEAHFEWYFPAALNRSRTGRRLGIPGIPMAEHQEPTPLARAEWLKFFALFFNKERAAEEAFDRIEEAYEQARLALPPTDSKPKVLVGVPWSEGWSLHGTNSLGARLIEDAGGHYLDAGNRSGEANVTVPFEAALASAREADVWLLGPDFSFGNRLEEQTIDDPRFGFVPAVSSERVFVGHVGYPDGVNPWWDYALVEPHLELLDLMAILHPEIHGNRRLRFYRPLESGTRRGRGEGRIDL